MLKLILYLLCCVQLQIGWLVAWLSSGYVPVEKCSVGINGQVIAHGWGGMITALLLEASITLFVIYFKQQQKPTYLDQI